MGLLLGIAFFVWVVYSFGKGVAGCESAMEVVSYLAGIMFVFYLVGAVFG